MRTFWPKIPLHVPLIGGEIESAEREIIKYVQKRSYPSELSVLQNCQPKASQLSTKLNDGTVKKQAQFTNLLRSWTTNYFALADVIEMLQYWNKESTG